MTDTKITTDITTDAALKMAYYSIVSMYEDPIESSFIEILANALDVHRSQNVTLPIEVRVEETDSKFETKLSVRDYGKGITHKVADYTIFKVGSYGHSKGQKVQGKYGIGSKSALSCAPFIRFTFYRGGTADVFDMFVTDDKPVVSFVSSEATNELDGCLVQATCIDKYNYKRKHTDRLIRYVRILDEVYRRRRIDNQRITIIGDCSVSYSSFEFYNTILGKAVVKMEEKNIYFPDITRHAPSIEPPAYNNEVPCFVVSGAYIMKKVWMRKGELDMRPVTFIPSFAAFIYEDYDKFSFDVARHRAIANSHLGCCNELLPNVAYKELRNEIDAFECNPESRDDAWEVAMSHAVLDRLGGIDNWEKVSYCTYGKKSKGADVYVASPTMHEPPQTDMSPVGFNARLLNREFFNGKVKTQLLLNTDDRDILRLRVENEVRTIIGTDTVATQPNRPVAIRIPNDIIVGAYGGFSKVTRANLLRTIGVSAEQAENELAKAYVNPGVILLKIKASELAVVGMGALGEIAYHRRIDKVFEIVVYFDDTEYDVSPLHAVSVVLKLIRMKLYTTDDMLSKVHLQSKLTLTVADLFTTGAKDAWKPGWATQQEWDKIWDNFLTHLDAPDMTRCIDQGNSLIITAEICRLIRECIYMDVRALKLKRLRESEIKHDREMIAALI
ncbi:MAG: ATP-binding protein [Tannerellaceae bacterium]